MNRTPAKLLAAALVALPLTALAGDKKPPPPPYPACITVSTEVRYANYGYDHIVRIASDCKQPAACVIRTNVNPDAIDARVEAGKTIEVVTFRGSPASEFEADVRCKLEKG